MLRWLRGRRSFGARLGDRRASNDALIERSYTISCGLGGFGTVKIAWEGTSREDVRDSFLAFIGDHDEFAELNDPAFRQWRSVHVRFNGQDRLLTFRTDWIAGFTVH